MAARGLIGLVSALSDAEKDSERKVQQTMQKKVVHRTRNKKGNGLRCREEYIPGACDGGEERMGGEGEFVGNRKLGHQVGGGERVGDPEWSSAKGRGGGGGWMQGYLGG